MPGAPPKGCSNYIHQVHIADGFTDDCEELIHRWLKTETLTYETFCEIWKDMQFNFLYYGRTSGAEMAELTEEMLQIAKHYMVSNTDNIEESVAGLFLVYALLRLQPYAGFAALRVVPADAAALKRIETCARRERRYDVLYILGSVLIEGPVHFHAVNRERGMELAVRKYLEGTTGMDRLGIRPKGVFYRQNEESDLLRELNCITKRYTEAKKAIGGEKCTGLNYTDERLASDLHSSLKEIINGIIEEGPEANKKMQDHYSKVQAIKEKAMMNAVDGVKFLSTVSDGASGSKGKKKLLSKSSKRKRKDSSSSNSDISLTSEDESSPSDGEIKERRVEFAKDLSLEAFDQEKDLKLAKGEEEREIDIQIDSLPVFIRTEQGGQIYDIEIVDNLKEQTLRAPESGNTETRLKRLTDVSLEKVVTSDASMEQEERTQLSTETEKRTEATLEKDKTVVSMEKKKTKVSKKKVDSGEGTSGVKKAPRKKKEPKQKQEPKKRKVAKKRETVEVEKLQKKEKRELKKPRIKSKFKRMGMLGMANFDDNTRKSPRGKKGNETK